MALIIICNLLSLLLLLLLTVWKLGISYLLWWFFHKFYCTWISASSKDGTFCFLLCCTTVRNLITYAVFVCVNLQYSIVQLLLIKLYYSDGLVNTWRLIVFFCTKWGNFLLPIGVCVRNRICECAVNVLYSRLIDGLLFNISLMLLYWLMCVICLYYKKINRVDGVDAVFAGWEPR